MKKTKNAKTFIVRMRETTPFRRTDILIKDIVHMLIPSSIKEIGKA